jgi:hypothetical protein
VESPNKSFTATIETDTSDPKHYLIKGNRSDPTGIRRCCPIMLG